MSSPATPEIANADWFRQPQLATVFLALNREGHQARLVGGAIRNSLIGLAVGDLDLATTAEPDQVMRFAAEAGLKCVPTGIEHGTVTIVVDHLPFEVTTLRRDVETDGRRATIAYTRDWAEDAARRDFTINALYADESGTVFDPLGQGRADLCARRIRFIGAARDRIREDYLRILRFFRFTADYSHTLPEAGGLSACIAERHGLAILSAERVRVELLRILMTRQPLLALQPMIDSGLIHLLLAGVVRLAHFEALCQVEAKTGVEVSAIRRLAAFAVFSPECAGHLSRRLKLSNADAARLGAMAALAPRISEDPGASAVRALLYRYGRETFLDRVLIAWARSLAGGGRVDETRWLQLVRQGEEWARPEFPVSGRVLIDHDIKPGPEMGKILRGLEADWIASDFMLSKEDLLKRIPKSGNRFLDENALPGS